MPQAFLSLAALVLVSGLVLNLTRASAWGSRNQENREIEVAAMGLSSEILTLLEGRSFDERTTPSSIETIGRGSAPTSPTAFSAPTTFGTADRGGAGCNLLRPSQTPDCDDVDDVSSTRWEPVSVTLAPGRTLQFQVRLQVIYVDDPASMTASTVPTIHKRVTMDVQSLSTGSPTTSVFQTTRVLTYDPVKARRDYQASRSSSP